MARKWKVSYSTEEAAQEVAFLFVDADRQHAIKRVLAALAAQDDPRSPQQSSDLKVGELVEDAPGWFSAAVPRYAIRLVFRLLILKDNKLTEIGRYETVSESAVEYWIEIMRAGFIGEVYDPTELRQRYRKYRE